MMPIRCRHCGRADLPVVPGTVGGNGTIGHSVAHVKQANTLATLHPCTEGMSREDLERASDDSVLLGIKRMIWNDDSLWDL